MSEELTNETELRDPIPEGFKLQGMVTAPCSHAAVQEDTESEEEYASRPIPELPPSVLLGGLSHLWTYPINGVVPVQQELQSLINDERLADYSQQLQGIFDLLDEYNKSEETVVGADMIQLDYTRMFIGSFKMYCPPYASYYLDGEKQIYGPAAAFIEDLYATFGLEIKQTEHDMPDHIRFLLSFLSLLAAGYETTSSVDLAHAYTDFRLEYVDTWTGEFSERLNKYGSYPFYKELLAFTLEVI